MTSPNSPRRITPSDQPHGHYELSCDGIKWEGPFNDVGPLAERWTHWRPLSPSGPKPEQVVGGEQQLYAPVAQKSPITSAQGASADSGPKETPAKAGEVEHLLSKEEVAGSSPARGSLSTAAPQSVRSSDRDAMHNLIADLHQFQDGQTAYDKIFDTVARHWPSPVAQQDWAKKAELLTLAWDEYANISENSAKSATARMCAKQLRDALRHAPAASGGGLAGRLGVALDEVEAMIECGLESTDDLPHRIAKVIHSHGTKGETRNSLIKRSAEIIRVHLAQASPAPHLKETEGDSARLDWLEKQATTVNHDPDFHGDGTFINRWTIYQKNTHTSGDTVRSAIDAAMFAPANDSTKQI